MSEPFGPRQRELLDAWRTTANERASGREFDFTERRHTTRLHDRLDTFLEEPTEDAFESVWMPETLRGAVVGGPGMVLRSWDSIQDLASFLRTVRDAEDYDERWTERFVSDSVVWELYGRLHPEREPILSGDACRALQDFGYGTIRTFAEGTDAMQSFRADYEAVVGHATAGTDHEVPLSEEIETFLHLVHVLGDDQLLETLAGEGEYPALIEWERDSTDAKITLSGVTPLVDAYAAARAADAYEDVDDADEYWGGQYWESWKQGFRAEFADATAGIDLTALDPEDLDPLLAAMDDASDLSAAVPPYLLGGRSGGIAWSDFKSLTRERPEEAADVLSLLFDDSEHLPSRLARFRRFYDGIDTSGGPTLGLATALLTFAYPDEYVMYRYTEQSSFFDEFSDYEVTTGFDTDQYFYLNEACKRVRDRIDEAVGDDTDVTMLDVHTLLYVWDNDGHPER
jgi:hypothetical protein